MNILYLSYWGINEGLTQSAILPHLYLIEEFKEIKEIIFVTIERKKIEVTQPKVSGKIRHMPIHSSNLPMNSLNKINDFIIFPRELKKIIISNNVKIAISHGSPGGALLHKSCFPKIPYYVFFEPHSQYMLESGVWSRFDLRYIFMRKWENLVTKNATQLLCVTQNFQNELLKKGVDPNRLKFVPNFVDSHKFNFDENKRKKIRDLLSLSDEMYVGIYVGKFGGIYLNESAFDVFGKAFQFFQNKFFLIILTPDSTDKIFFEIRKMGIDDRSVLVKSVKYDEVSAYLSASDFAFSLQQPKLSNRYLSPLKNGEYWMNGLPILMMEGVGDEMNYIEEEEGGKILKKDFSNLNDALLKIKSTLDNQSLIENRHRISKIALAHRSKDFTITAFRNIFISSPST
jgi:glycosyltransferase involved in cell wall biosynthesis